VDPDGARDGFSLLAIKFPTVWPMRTVPYFRVSM
jgi:hypothetical protein